MTPCARGWAFEVISTVSAIMDFVGSSWNSLNSILRAPFELWLFGRDPRRENFCEADSALAAVPRLLRTLSLDTLGCASVLRHMDVPVSPRPHQYRTWPIFSLFGDLMNWTNRSRYLICCSPTTKLQMRRPVLGDLGFMDGLSLSLAYLEIRLFFFFTLFYRILLKYGP